MSNPGILGLPPGEWCQALIIHSLFIPAIMIDGEIIVAGKDIGEEELETIIRRHLDKS